MEQDKLVFFISIRYISVTYLSVNGYTLLKNRARADGKFHKSSLQGSL